MPPTLSAADTARTVFPDVREKRLFSMFENQTNEARFVRYRRRERATRTRGSLAMATSSSSPCASRASAATATRDPAHPDTEKVVCSSTAPARGPPVGGLVASRHHDDAPVNDLRRSAPSGAVATDLDDASVLVSSTNIDTLAPSSSAPLETHRGARPARGFPPETASSRKETVAKAPVTAAFDASSVDSGIEDTDSDVETPVAMSPDTSLVIGGPIDAGPLAGGAGDDAKALERRVTGSPDSVLGDGAFRASLFFDSDASADEADGASTPESASPLCPDAVAVEAVDGISGRGLGSDQATTATTTTKKKTVSFASYSAWAVHDIGSCRDLSREKRETSYRGAGWLANPTHWLKAGLSLLGALSGVSGQTVGCRDGNGDGVYGKKRCLLKRALRESRRNARENAEYNAAYAEAVDGLSRAAEREAKARRQRERRRRQTAWC